MVPSNASRLLVVAGSFLLGGCQDLVGAGGGEIRISGHLLRAGDRAPVSGGRVVATTYRDGQWSVHQRRAAWSAADGRYSIDLDCPNGSQLFIGLGYESGRSPFGESGRDDLVLHAIEGDGRTLEESLIERRITCGGSQRWIFDFLLKTPLRQPAEVVGGHRFAALSAGVRTVCGVTTVGTAYCWGEGALGDGRYRPFYGTGSLPVQVSGGLSFAALSVGEDVTCGITTDRIAYCWGGYHTNAIGDGSFAGTPRLVPARVSGENRFVSIEVGGDHACALNESGEAFCWGTNQEGQLGSGTQASPRPVPVLGGHRFSSLAAGSRHTCGITVQGPTYCWGIGPALGAQRTQPSGVPVPVSGGHLFVELSAGAYHVCGLTAAGTAYCWGGNGAGQTGSGSTSTLILTPSPVVGAQSFSHIGAGFEHTCAVTTGGQLFCWGRNEAGQFGSSSPAQSSTPTPLQTVSPLGFTRVWAGMGGPSSGFTCAVTPEERAYCWGSNASMLGSPP